MLRAFQTVLLAVSIACCGLFLSGPAAPAPVRAGDNEQTPAGDPKTIQIGLMSTLFRDLPTPLAAVVARPMSSFMESQTGARGEIQTAPTADALGRLLSENKVHLAVFHGFEFAWPRVHYPELQPLVIAVNRHRHLKAILIVRDDHLVGSVKDLTKCAMALAKSSRDHSRMFLDQLCSECNSKPADLFSEVTNPASIEDALDDVVDDVVRATVVDGVSLEAYKARKPARFARLKQVRESCVFPAAAIAYHPGGLEEDWARKFKECMMNAQQGLLGRQMMVMWNLTSLEAVPADYEQVLADFIKVFPPPDRGKGD